ncbi:hypothetical protein QAD02_000696 [Eretmocerus hayati]|uniref:Uncharacterized protein n=1 Tax=Eretmocerus hayati TaxID=131215 RepID=A0ACC2NE47_9HYME|nr:hypothetical protein QAD02_000696 [Eretmocerus hayati]
MSSEIHNSQDNSTNDSSSTPEDSDIMGTEADEPITTLISLLDLLIESHYNLKSRKTPNDNRYRHALELFCAWLRLTSGPLVYESIAHNFKNTIPSLSSINRFIGQFAETVLEGELMVDQMVKFLNDRGLPRVVVLNEDATRLVSKLSYNSRTNQCVGRVLPYDENSMPIPGSFRCPTLDVIENYFKHDDASKSLHVYMVQPVADGVPSFCSLMFGTRNEFDAVDSIIRLNYIRNQIVQ